MLGALSLSASSTIPSTTQNRSTRCFGSFVEPKRFDSVMAIQERKPRRTETSEEREARLEKEHRKALDRALAEQDALDDMVRRSIAMHGA